MRAHPLEYLLDLYTKRCLLVFVKGIGLFRMGQDGDKKDIWKCWYRRVQIKVVICNWSLEDLIARSERLVDVSSHRNQTALEHRLPLFFIPSRLYAFTLNNLKLSVVIKRMFIVLLLMEAETWNLDVIFSSDVLFGAFCINLVT